MSPGYFFGETGRQENMEKSVIPSVWHTANSGNMRTQQTLFKTRSEQSPI